MFAVVGLIAGIFSGLFGVGGGVIMVPMLVAFAGLDRRMASGTSLLAILPTSIVGAISYGVGGHVSLVAGGVLAIGTVIGAQLGTWLMSRTPTQVLRWAFVAFLVAVGVQMLLVTPVRGVEVTFTAGTVVALVGVGLATGILAGLLGVGGGVVVVPALIVGFAFPDLLAKGTSLLLMVPTALSGTVANVRRRSVHVRGGLLVGVGACLTVPIGTWFSQWLDPQVASWLFVGFLLVIAARTVAEALAARRGTG